MPNSDRVRTNSDSLVSRLREMGQLAWDDRNAYGSLGDYELVAHDLREAAAEIERLRRLLWEWVQATEVEFGPQLETDQDAFSIAYRKAKEASRE